MGLFNIFKKKTEEESSISIYTKEAEEEYLVNKDIVINKLINLLKELTKIEYKSDEYKLLLNNNCTKNMIAKINESNKEKKYDYINKECSIYFTEKEESMCFIEIYYEENMLEKKEKFVFRKKYDEWLLDEVYTGYSNKESWKITTL